jgi:hypothetical protein
MNTIELEPSATPVKTAAIERPDSILKRFEAFAESQKNKRLGWFMISLLAQAVIFLPIPAALMYYCDASVSVLAIGVGLFFINLVAGMAGSKINVLMILIAITTIVNVAMILAYVL